VSGLTFHQAHVDDYIDAVVRAVMSDSDAINRARRSDPTQDEMCPFRVVGIGGHWEELTEPGAFHHFASRLFWMAGALGPSPLCMTALCLPVSLFFGGSPYVAPGPAATPSAGTCPAAPNSHPDPTDYWMTLAWLVVPASIATGAPNPFCTTLSGQPDPGVVNLLVASGMAAGLELVGRRMSSSASRAAASQFAAAIDQSVASARNNMDPCAGKVIIDVVGYSRSSSVVAEALRRITHPSLVANAEVSMTVMDGITIDFTEPVEFGAGQRCRSDTCRPWARSGFLTRDPHIGPVGNELRSSLYMNRPDPADPLGTLFDTMSSLLFVPVLLDPASDPKGMNRYRDIMGLPSGFPREDFLGTGEGLIGGNGRVFANNLDGTHVEPLKYLLETGGALRTDTLPAAASEEDADPDFTFVTTTTLGPFLNDPRGELPAARGWARSSAIQRLIDANDPSLVPPSCRPAGSTTGPQPLDDPTATASLADGVTVKIREFVMDPFFSLTRGIVKNATDLVASFSHFAPDAIDLLAEAGLEGFAQEVATTGLPPGGVWQVSGEDERCRDPLDATINRAQKCLSIRATAGQPFRATLAQRVIKPITGKPEPDDLSSAALVFETWRDHLLDLRQDEPAWDDALKTMSGVLAGAGSTADAYARFPNPEVELFQDLDVASLEENHLVVRVGFRFRSLQGTLTVELEGNGMLLSESFSAATYGKTRNDVLFEVDGDASLPPSDLVPDRITLRGKRVNVFWVSVKNRKPIANSIDGRIYDVVVLPEGTDWYTAKAHAHELGLGGVRGHLPSFHADDDLLGVVAPEGDSEEAGIEIDAHLWIGAKGSAHDEDDFKWADKTAFDYAPWSEDTVFGVTPTRERYVALVPRDENAEKLAWTWLDYALIENGAPIGFLVEYAE
jgi:hypothetical protein